jgi:SAM-dependent methyltransferase
MTTPSESWDGSYAASTPPPWDVGRPQPVFARLADAGLLSGRVLDSGCGTGEHTLLAASKGADALGIDISPRAIQQARAKAVERGIAARFQVADVLNLGQFGLTFDTVIDSGMFHVFDDDDRVRYVASLGSALEPGGSCYLMCFSEQQPGDFGPRRVRQDDLRTAFSDGWDVTEIVPEKFEVNPGSGFGTAAVHAWLATVRRRLFSPRRDGPRPPAATARTARPGSGPPGSPT